MKTTSFVVGRSSGSYSSSENSDLDENYVPLRPINKNLLGSFRPVTRSRSNLQKQTLIKDRKQSKSFNSKILLE
ncbi:Hypothetical protein CINCED_3A020466 [Cinara cedri]|uniref:Uncharacterized protein n=1 Tax=Cinara cedri TaxID=506608 RepID=A0A5E4MVC5_9HEMI|nr:Hypothetical protein CINCED_3A020466 [Cinara cedri]